MALMAMTCSPAIEINHIQQWSAYYIHNTQLVALEIGNSLLYLVVLNENF